MSDSSDIGVEIGVDSRDEIDRGECIGLLLLHNGNKPTVFYTFAALSEAIGLKLAVLQARRIPDYPHFQRAGAGVIAGATTRRCSALSSTHSYLPFFTRQFANAVAGGSAWVLVSALACRSCSNLGGAHGGKDKKEAIRDACHANFSVEN